jgi:elongation factor Ts
MEASVTWLRERGIAKAVKKEGVVAAEGLCSYAIDGNKCVTFELNSQTDFVAQNAKFIDLINNVGKFIVASKATNTEEALECDANGKTLATFILEASGVIGEKISLRRVSVINKQADQVFGAYKHMGGTISSIALLEGGDADLARDMAMQVASMNPTYVSMNDIPAEITEAEKNVQIEIVKNDPELSTKPEKVIEGIIRGRVSKTLQDISLNDQIFFKDGSSKVSAVLKQANATVVEFVRFAVGEGIEKREENFAEEVAKASQV